MPVTEQELRGLKSAIYNANSAAQHVRTLAQSLEMTLAKQQAEIDAIGGTMRVLNERLEKVEEALEKRDIL